MKPIIHLYALCWNEEKMIPYFMEYYKKFVDEFYIFDNESTDSSIQLLKQYDNVHIKTYHSENTIREDLYLMIKNNEWKKSRGIADFVIVCDIDEFLYHDNILLLLDEMKRNNYTINRSIGYDMISEKFDFTYEKNITELLKIGTHNYIFNKICIFNPNEIDEINYEPGAHTAEPVGNVNYSPESVKLLHYKFLGLEYTLDRFAIYRSRLSEYNRIRSYCWEYQFEREKHIRRFYEILNDAEIVF